MKYRLKVLPSLNRLGMRILIFLVYTLPVVFGHFKHFNLSCGCSSGNDPSASYFLSFWLYSLLLYVPFIFYYGYGHPERRIDPCGESDGFYAGLCFCLPVFGHGIFYAIVTAIYLKVMGL